MQVITACLTLLLVFAGGAAARAETPVIEARSTLEKWIEARQLTSKTRSDWHADKETLTQTVQLFQRELDAIEEKMTTVSTNNVQAQKEQTLAEAQRKELVDATESATVLAGGLEQHLMRIAPAFPRPLTDRVDPLLKRIPADPNDTKISSVQRLQNLVGILNEVDKFNAAVTVVNEVQKNPLGAEVQVETLYLGLAQAYFVDKAGDYAGVGLPSLLGWEWKEQNELADRIKSAIAMYKNTAPAGFVSLPVRIN